VLYNGNSGDRYDYISDLKFSDDGKDYIAIASEGGRWINGMKYTGGKYFLVHNGEKGDPFDYITEAGLTNQGGFYLYITASMVKWDKRGAYSSSRYSVYRNNEIIEKNVFNIKDLWIKGYNWGYSLKEKKGSAERKVLKSFIGSEVNAVSEVYNNWEKNKRGYIVNIGNASFLTIETLK
jgi:hypothetical protein